MAVPDLSDDNFESLTDRELFELLTETDHRLERLQHEVRRRMQARAMAEHRREQHAEISRIVELLDQTSVDWQKVREFFGDSLFEAQESPRP